MFKNCAGCGIKIQYATKTAFTTANKKYGTCKPCTKKRWAKNNHQKTLESKKRWNRENKEYQTKYWEQNKADLILKRREWRQLKWIEVTAAQRLRSHKRRAILKEGDVTKKDIEFLLSIIKNCPLCGVEMNIIYQHPASKNIDHIIPLCVGGKNEKTNIRVICRKCNLKRPRTTFNTNK